MEIREWIRAIGSRLALIAVVAGVAALLAAVLALFQPQQYRATATVSLPDVPVTGPLTSAVAQRIANFEGAVTSDGVLDAVAEQTGAPRERLDAVSSTRSGSSNVIEVRYVGRSQDEARAVVEAASREAMLLQANSDLAFAAAGVDVAQEAFDSAVDDFEARAGETDFFYPDSQLQQLGDDLLAAERQDDEAEIERITALLPVAQEVQRLKNLADASLVNLTSALDRLRQAEGNVEAANSIPIPVGDVVRLSKLQAMIRQGAYAALFGAALAVGFVIIVELLRSGTGTTRPSLPRPTRQRSSAGAF